ncbi:MAG: 23S rRNA (adenine(2503)-C(2))-methyltransferase RlmN [Bacilli bacterium]|nr:23S rRNA (adenine(2503)-C(2))-methyltransferase RlmN [Bacilli bacterium]HHU24219.1 23S rRNA (adenine(2503)-C(2))-methyltransferase RlmN [Acholeplasmataceae bacterium]
MKNNIYNFSLKALEEYFIAQNDKKFRATQIFEWLYRHRVTLFEKMTNLSKKALEHLHEHFAIERLNVEKKIVSSDGTTKYLFRLHDGHLIETVLMRHSYGNSVCVTSQVGCNMGCSFCASGELGRIRNLTHAEMVLQVLHVQSELDATNERVTNIVVMGIGEPFDNFQTVLDFCRTVNFAKGLEIGARHITISTCGIVPKIFEFAEFKLQVNLAISLHAPNDELRSKIMKINRSYPLHEVMEAVKAYLAKTNRRVTFEYILLKDINDTTSHAHQLVNLLRGINCYVNLIPYNEVLTKEYKRTLPESAQVFFNVLHQAGINVTFRTEHGDDIRAACGQLRAQTMKEKKR